MEKTNGIFRHLLVLGRPAGGKSEFIDFMLRQTEDNRAQRFHLGLLRVFDDFPILWEYCLDDDLRERLGQPRLYSRRAEPAGYATSAPIIWSLLIDRINRIVRRECLEHPELYARSSIQLKGIFYFLAPAVGLLLCVLVIAVLLIDLSSHPNGLLFLLIFVVWVAAGAVYSGLRLRRTRGAGDMD